MPTLTLLHTNDLHGSLTEYGARFLAELKAAHAPCLLLDSGDAVGVGNVTWHAHGERAHELMNGASYDAGAMGNREFHFRPGPQRAKLQLARFPILCANLVAPDGYGGSRRQALLRLDDGPTVRVFGLLVPMVTEAMAARLISPARFGEPSEAAAEQVAAADGGPVVCLSHLGLERDRRLAAACPGVDVILGGHSHTPLAQPERVGRALIAQNEPHGGTLTKVVLTVEDGRVVDTAAEVLPLRLKAGSA
jgi:2',3'-cyclic-nucleotide 2'-phosphodiesterase (5'-nucleotidase family)